MGKPLFESKECNRCFGLGRYGHYGTCFKCGGAGHLLTKRGQAAQDYLNAMRRIPGESFVPGMTILAEGFCAGSFSQPSKWHTVERVELLKGRECGYTGAQADVDCVRISADGYRSVGPVGTTYRRGWSAAEKAEQKAKALAYQATLTKSGTVAKRPAKAVAP